MGETMLIQKTLKRPLYMVVVLLLCVCNEITCLLYSKSFVRTNGKKLLSVANKLKAKIDSIKALVKKTRYKIPSAEQFFLICQSWKTY